MPFHKGVEQITFMSWSLKTASNEKKKKELTKFKITNQKLNFRRSVRDSRDASNMNPRSREIINHDDMRTRYYG